MTVCRIPCLTAPIYPPSATRIIFSSTDPTSSFWLKTSFGSPLYTSKITAHRPLRDLTLLQVPTRLLELQTTNLFNILWECPALSLPDDLVAIVYLSILRKEGQKFLFEQLLCTWYYWWVLCIYHPLPTLLTSMCPSKWNVSTPT